MKFLPQHFLITLPFLPSTNLFRTKNFIERPFSKTQLSSKKEGGQNKGKKISEILLKYDTDKVRGDKPEGHCYGESYDEIFSQFEDNVDLNLLEIGVQKGGSLLAWKEYFPKSNIYGVDIVDERIYVSDKVNFILSDIKKYKTDLKFDIIIDEINTIPFFTPLYVKEKKIQTFES